MSAVKKEKIKIAATRVGMDKPPEHISPDGADKNLDADAIKKYADANAGRALAALRTAGERGADLALTHEDIMGLGHYTRNELRHVFARVCEEIPGPTSERLSGIAREYGMHVAACYYERERDKFYNTAVLIGRDGELIGKFRKVHLPRLEQWLITPGSETPVFETDIGNIGIAICYDIAFPEHCRALALNGADIILHPTVGWGFVYGERRFMGEALNRVRAAENQCCLVCSINPPQGRSCIISNNGDILGEYGSADTDGIAVAEFAPDYDLMKAESYWSFLANVPSVRARMVFERRPGAYGPITESAPKIVRGRYSEYKFSENGSELANEIGVKWDMWRQGVIDLPYIWE